MLRNRSNRIPHPVQDRKREGNTNPKDSVKYKTAQAENQADGSFPADGHETIQNRTNSQRQTYNKKTFIDFIILWK